MTLRSIEAQGWHLAINHLKLSELAVAFFKIVG